MALKNKLDSFNRGRMGKDEFAFTVSLIGCGLHDRKLHGEGAYRGIGGREIDLCADQDEVRSKNGLGEKKRQQNGEIKVTRVRMVENTVTRQKKFPRLDPPVVANEHSQGCCATGGRRGR